MRCPLLPQELQQIRSELRLSQEELAVMLRVSWGSVNRWEKGHYTPTGPMLDLYLALNAALKRPGGASKIVDGSYLGRGQFLLGLFTLAYGTPKQRKGLVDDG